MSENISLDAAPLRGARAPRPRSRWREAALLGGACLLLGLGIWANTGTLAPYGATLEHPFMWEPCNYPLNIDHFHFKATFLMLDGAPREQWEFSVVLRRILYPLLAYPAMKLLGFGAGGLVVNVLIAWVALVVFWRALRRRLGGDASPLVLLLLATYPGWMYWAGLPYSYAAVVPLSLLCQVLMWRLEDAESRRAVLALGLAMGVLFTGYDLLPIFGSAAVFMLAWRRRWASSAIFAVAQMLPTAAVAALLHFVYRVPIVNSNSGVYAIILRSFLSPGDWSSWGALLAKLPSIAVDNFLFSNFLFLPLLFLVALVLAGRGGRPIVGSAEAWVFIAVGLLFTFNNAAPPYPGFQMRGLHVARLYQPVVAAMVAVVAAACRRVTALPMRRRALWAAVGLTVCAQLWVVFAPLLGAPWLSGELYYRFYRHAPRPVYAETIARLGARPVGFCASAPSAPASVTH